MSKIFKISIILFIILLLINTVVLATDINMNLGSENNNSIDTNNIDTNNTDSDLNTIDEQPQVSDGISGTAAPSGVSSIAQENMSFSNILNILVITVGVILILLSIAILIRLKG